MTPSQEPVAAIHDLALGGILTAAARKIGEDLAARLVGVKPGSEEERNILEGAMSRAARIAGAVHAQAAKLAAEASKGGA